jgi:dihydroflavonol-4-reductase
VRTTVRNLDRESGVRAVLKAGGADAGDRLSFVAADLEHDAGWAEAAVGCDYVLHVASPFPPNVPKHEEELRRLMDGGIPACPRLYFGVVDVRDVADLHIRAMTHPAAQGERFLAVAGDCMSILDIAKLLRRRMGASAKKVPRFQLPDWLMRIAAMRNPAARQMLPELGKIKNASHEKAARMLAWTARSGEESIVATAESLMRLGLVSAGS